LTKITLYAVILTKKLKNFYNIIKKIREMKKVLFILSMLVVSSDLLLAQADFSRVEVYGTYSEKDIFPCVDISATNQLFNHFKLAYSAAFFQDSRRTMYHGALGFAYSPADWLSVGLKAGLKEGPNRAFVSSQLWLGNDKVSMGMLLNKSIKSDDYFYRTSLSYNTSSKLSLGLMAWRFHGIGPLIRYEPKKFKLAIFAFPAYDLDDKIAKVTLGLYFDVSAEAVRSPW